MNDEGCINDVASQVILGRGRFGDWHEGVSKKETLG